MCDFMIEPNGPFSPNKMEELVTINERLNINKYPQHKLVFVYTTPKVGSTCIVSSLRVFGSEHLTIIHIHDEDMLKVLLNLKTMHITINDLILFNRLLGKEVYVINVYRSPIERKISAFFEKIGTHHFNNDDATVDTYDVNRVITRFNNIFQWISTGDHFMDKYELENIPDKFDCINKYNLLINHGVHYINLRLKDSVHWGNILTCIFGFPIYVIKDYESSHKTIRNLYSRFKEMYKIPMNLLNEIATDKYLNYYYSQEELDMYLNEWRLKSTDSTNTYSCEEYKLYQSICVENSHRDVIQTEHYFDSGCLCKKCTIKRTATKEQILSHSSNDEMLSLSSFREKIFHLNPPLNLRKHVFNKIKKTFHSTLPIRHKSISEVKLCMTR
jgi:hypothetical protein